MTRDDFAGWVPAHVYWRRGQPMVDWVYLGAQSFAEPFFDQTINRALGDPATLLLRRQTALDELNALAKETPGVAPGGFIFHVSRCRSTLLAQMLAALPGSVVISEAGPLDGVLRANRRDPSVTDEQRVRWLRGMIGALGRPRAGDERRLFVKFDAWHTLDLPLVRRAFPGVPWLFVYRDPLEVLLSHRREPGRHMVPGLLRPDVFGLDPGLTLDEYGAQVLGRICAAALDALDAGVRCGDADSGRVLDYRQLPEAGWGAVLAWFGVAPQPGDDERMQAVAGFDAKNPGVPFAPAAGGSAPTDEQRRAIERWAMPLVARLAVKPNV